MRRVRYQVACSVDGCIADAADGYDWIVADPEIDFGELTSEYDTLLMGRRTYELVGGSFPGMKVVVFSRTLRAEEHPEVEVVSGDAATAVREMKRRPGRDIWLYGGGELFRSLLDAGCVDTVEPAFIPYLVGGGVPFLPSPAQGRRLKYTGHRLYETSGILLIRYDVES